MASGRTRQYLIYKSHEMIGSMQKADENGMLAGSEPAPRYSKRRVTIVVVTAVVVVSGFVLLSLRARPTPRYLNTLHAPGRTDPPIKLALAPDGRTLAINRAGVRLLDLATGGEQTIPTGGDFAESLAFSPDGQTLAAGFGSGAVRLFDIGAGSQRLSLRVSESVNVSSLVFANEGKAVVCRGAQDWQIRLSDTSTGKPISIFGEPNVHVGHFVMSPDWKTLATFWGTRTDVTLWDIASRTRRAVLGGHPAAVEAVAFSLDGSLLASASSEDGICLWDPATGQLLGRLDGRSGTSNSLEFSPDGTLLAAGCGDPSKLLPAGPGRVELWDVKQRQIRCRWVAHEQFVTAVHFCLGGNKLVTADRQTVKLWDVSEFLGQ
jgi:WD40 repeat protein